ncbi:MAG: hypothetical protein QF430_03195 [Candidatus Marinimicrobia bacterium]|nr:hypothetical protein [Candidatus Neomarinimicrobiota bacterium]MDP7071871.1 hypothetical protein [Candidatus Neomarinimicrobiota bacterium]
MSENSISGILRNSGSGAFVESPDGNRHFEGRLFWDGYITHWKDQPIVARELPQKDYQREEPIIIMRPDDPEPSTPAVDLYYNERLVKYRTSTFGHNAINVNGEIFNFSHLLNENEVITSEEYFYRPALGEFAPSPRNGAFELNVDGRDYFDKFGRNFMRTIHVLRLTGLDTDKLAGIYHRELEIIHSSKRNPKNPEKYIDFSFWNRSCATIIRDGLIEYGINDISGFLPRDFFVSTIYAALLSKERLGIGVQLFSMPQLDVPEAAPSAMTPLFNPLNKFKLNKISKMIS